MKYEDLDTDTQSIIDAMCLKTGWTKEKSILALVEFGMLSMIAAIEKNRSEEIMKKVYDVVNSDSNLTEVAKVYQAAWCL